MKLQHALSLDYTHVASLDPDDVILYRPATVSAPPLFEPGPCYKPASPAWVAALLADGSSVQALWCRVFRLTEAERERREQAAREAEKRAAEASRQEALARAAKLLRPLWALTGRGEWPGIECLSLKDTRALVLAIRSVHGDDQVDTFGCRRADDLRRAVRVWALLRSEQ